MLFILTMVMALIMGIIMFIKAIPILVVMLLLTIGVFIFVGLLWEKFGGDVLFMIGIIMLSLLIIVFEILSTIHVN